MQICVSTALAPTDQGSDTPESTKKEKTNPRRTSFGYVGFEIILGSLLDIMSFVAQFVAM